MGISKNYDNHLTFFPFKAENNKFCRTFSIISSEKNSRTSKYEFFLYFDSLEYKFTMIDNNYKQSVLKIKILLSANFKILIVSKKSTKKIFQKIKTIEV